MREASPPKIFIISIFGLVKKYNNFYLVKNILIITMTLTLECVFGSKLSTNIFEEVEY